MKLKIKLDKGAKTPTGAHEWDAGLDIYSRETKTVPARGSASFDTGLHIELPVLKFLIWKFPTVGMLKSKSGLNVKYGITSEGVIDVGYTGSICVKLYNHSDCDYEVKEGDKISQLVILPVIIPNVLINVDDLKKTERGNGGFGSTGR